MIYTVIHFPHGFSSTHWFYLELFLEESADKALLRLPKTWPLLHIKASTSFIINIDLLFRSNFHFKAWQNKKIYDRLCVESHWILPLCKCLMIQVSHHNCKQKTGSHSDRFWFPDYFESHCFQLSHCRTIFCKNNKGKLADFTVLLLQLIS